MFREHRLCSAFVLRKGQESVWRPQPTNASTAITQYAVLKLASGKVAHITSGARTFGVATKAKASSDTSTDPIPVELARRELEYEVAVGTSGGTLAATTPGALADVNYTNSEPDKLNLSPSNNDCAVVAALDVTNGIAAVTFINTYY